MQIRKARREIWVRPVIAMFVFTGFFLSCAQKGVYHRVRKGQTLYRISLTYKVPLNTITRVNGIDDPFRIKEGELLFIPGASDVLHVPVIKPSAPDKNRIFVRPVHGKITGNFGEKRRRHYHKGVDIAAPRGTPVRAALSGKVVYAGSDYSGYGKTVIIDHQNGFMSLYSHLKKIVASEGKLVRQREIIGTVGKTGRATGPHLHFEIRYHEKLINPMRYMIH